MTETVTKKDIRSLSLEDLQQLFVEAGDKKFRGTQVYEWLWVKSAHTFEQMTNLAKATREWLEENFEIRAVNEEQTQVSSDRTIKSSFRLHDGHLVEGVLIPTPTRMTACVSSPSRM